MSHYHTVYIFAWLWFAKVFVHIIHVCVCVSDIWGADCQADKTFLFSTPASTQPRYTIPYTTVNHIFPHYDPLPPEMFPSYLWDTPDPFQEMKSCRQTWTPPSGCAHRVQNVGHHDNQQSLTFSGLSFLNPKIIFENTGNRFLYPQNTGVFCELPSFFIQLRISFANERNFQNNMSVSRKPWFISDDKM